jgi:hypothetical protein
MQRQIAEMLAGKSKPLAEKESGYPPDKTGKPLT